MIFTAIEYLGGPLIPAVVRALELDPDTVTLTLEEPPEPYRSWLLQGNPQSVLGACGDYWSLLPGRDVRGVTGSGPETHPALDALTGYGNRLRS